MSANPISVFDLLQAKILSHPNAVAVSKGGTELSYRDLDSYSLAIAELLAAEQVGVGDVVPILTSRCPHMVACVLAVIRVGAAWIPMEAGTWSQQRIQSVLVQVDCKCLLVTDVVEDWIMTTKKTILIQDDLSASNLKHSCNDGGKLADKQHQPVLFQGPSSPEDLAYVIFTSGTTGNPKGVAVRHRSLLNYLQSGESHAPFNMGICPKDVVLLTFSVAFDAYFGVLLSTLCGGGHLVLSEPSTFLDDVRKCTVIPATPTLLGTLPDPSWCPHLRAIFLGGESPSPELIRKWWSPNRKLYNAYGPTEATIAASMAELLPDRPITLGSAIRHSRLLLLDNELKECLEGEICISGVGLAAGYHNDSARTEERFIHWTEDERLYRTGDLGRRTTDGSIVFLGRKDSVVKNRGFLINIEAEVLPALFAQQGVQSAAAFMHSQRLFAFIAPVSELPRAEAIRHNMISRYDQFLVPDEIRVVDVLPQTTNGKVDVKALRTRLERDIKKKTIHEKSDDNDKMTEVAPVSRFDVLRNAMADALGIVPSSVDMESSFATLGGNSLLAIKLLSHLQQRGFKISLPEIFGAASLSLASGCLTKINLFQPTAPTGMRSTSMTATQVGIVTSTLRDPPKGYMVVKMVLPFENLFHRTALEGAWRSVIMRNKIFYAGFDVVNGTIDLSQEPQVIWTHFTSPTSAIDATLQQKTDELIRQARSHALESSDSVFRPLLAFTLITGAHTNPTLLWLVHHAQVDGWSVGKVVRDVREMLYHSGSPSTTAEFASYANVLPLYLDGVREKETDFWSTALRGLLDGTQLNLRRPKAKGVFEANYPSKDGIVFESRTLSLGVTLAQANHDSQVYGVSPAVTIYSAWALLLSIYSSSDHVVFGTVLSGRNFSASSDVKDIVGPLINVCPFPARVHNSSSDSPDKMHFLQQVQDQLLTIEEHQWSASEVLDKIAPGSRGRLYSTMVFLEYDLPEFSHVPHSENSQRTRRWNFERKDVPEFDLTLQGQIGSDGEIVFRALFNMLLYDEAVVTRMLSHLRNLYQALMDPRLSRLDQVRDAMFDSSEFLKLTRNSPTFFQPYTGQPTLKQAFEIGVDSWPNAIAIDSPSDGLLTYRELDKLANRLARHLVNLFHLTTNAVVAVLGDGSRNWLIGAIAIIKAGAVYLPIDSKLPIQRMNVMTKTANAVACLFPSKSSLNWFSMIQTPKVLIYELLEAFEGAASTSNASDDANLSTPLTTKTKPEDYAYVMFTSGSTGVPKGICVSHKSTLSHLAYEPARLHAHPGRRHAHMFSPGFDVSIAEIFGTLCYGATLVLKCPDDPFVHLTRVHATMITPSFLSVCSVAELQNLDTIYLIGEAVPQSLAERWSKDRVVYNAYGPCECTIAALFKRLEPDETVTLGRTIPRVGVYLLDQNRRPVPIGVAGEIYLTGIQVTGGYLGDHMAKVNSSVFLPDPFSPGHRMYKTGDAGMWTESMELLFLGRLDDSLVKVRGFRIELQEIEHAIQSSDSRIRAAVAIVSKEQDRILAFVSPKTIDTREVLERISPQLPPYARPSSLLALDSFPTTPNQKLDRKALWKLAEQHSADAHSSNPLERDEMNDPDRCHVTQSGMDSFSKHENSRNYEMIQRIWVEILGLPADFQLCADDDFLALGGTSLHQVAMAQRISAKLGIRVPVGLFVSNTLLSELVKALDEFSASEAGDPISVSAQRSKSFIEFLSSFQLRENGDGVGRYCFSGLSYLERAIFEMHERSDCPSTFNVIHEVHVRGQIRVDILQQAIRQVVCDHDILRCRFKRNPENGQLFKSYSARDCNLDVFRLGPANEQAAELSRYVEAPFDLGQDQLTRIAVVDDNDKTQREPTTKLVLVQHHIITDKTSTWLFFRKLGEIYSRLLQTHPITSDVGDNDLHKSRKAPSYGSWAHWRSMQPCSAPGSVEIEFWKHRLNPLPLSLFPRRISENRRGATMACGDTFGQVSFTLNTSGSSKTSNFSPSLDLYLSAVFMALCHVSGADDIVIGIPFIDRIEPGTDQILGLFLDRLPIKMSLRDIKNTEAELSLRLERLVPTTRLKVHEALSHGLPYDQIRRLFLDEDSEGDCDLFDVMFVYNRWDDRVTRDFSLSGSSVVQSASKRAPGAKFPLLVEIEEHEGGVKTCEIEYMRDLVSPSFVERLKLALENVIGLL